MQKSHTPLHAGQEVIVRDAPGLVLGTEIFAAVRVVHLRGIGGDNRDELRSLIAPFDVVHYAAPATRLRQTSRRRVLARAANTIADASAWDECWTASSARIELHAWQLEPA